MIQTSFCTKMFCKEQRQHRQQQQLYQLNWLLKRHKRKKRNWLKNAATFGQWQVPYFDFEQRPIVTNALCSLLHPIEEHEWKKTKNTHKGSSACCSKTWSQKWRVKEEMDSRKQERENVHLNERLNNLEPIIQSIIF